MRNKLVALRYVKAILANISSDQENSVLADIVTLNKLFSNDIVAKIDSKLLNIRQKKEFTSLAAEHLENRNLWSRLFDLLLEKDRFNIINEILTEMDKTILANNNIERVVLKLASQQSPEIINSIKVKIEKILKKEVVLEIKIDSEIIGGFEATSESKVIDASIRNSLKKFVLGS